ncbi:hypothetical protein TS71_11455 [Mycolicibacterium neoaurum]|uniref:Uncharacterized protein n=1 Tax=Mycolicibacterium neoaurum VKM Ac-1815D TaxID=700508 RepID=V5XJS3_MYCNE|nr:hypothetical protein D174_21830 [Mycolicibacterium neoaurum VKM Ac-1815D]AMO07300.1 hypothetical protein MyAD_21415 [Mycolicibacterium neoaurum]AXK74315.1 hypothetical protein DXK33_03455 [Mycolicibacterium neoaurum]KJQ49994.1 hypothetical protein TS71_11455 [Mycolicibacterium neoaurum]KUM06330.1 hypothetical protein AVZ31_21640 [Mycolicibacterium neoaurum]
MVRGKLREAARQMRERVSAPPDQIVIFAGLPRFCAWPILLQIQQVVVQRRVVVLGPRTWVDE